MHQPGPDSLKENCISSICSGIEKKFVVCFVIARNRRFLKKFTGELSCMLQQMPEIFFLVIVIEGFVIYFHMY
jgi:uncharacterized membrane protein